MTPAEEAEIIRTHAPFVLKHALRAAKTSHRELDDCIQDGYIALVDSCRKWTPEGGANIRTFATSRMRWAAYSAWRKSKRQVETISMDEDRSNPMEGSGEACNLHDLIAAPSTDADEGVDSSAKGEVLRGLVAALPARERIVIQKRFFEGLTLEEVGDHWGLTRERVRQIQVMALDRLRGRLERLGVRS